MANWVYKGREISPIDLQRGILGKESAWGTNTTPRYEKKFHNELLAKSRTKEWIPTPAERRIIKERGFNAATKQFSTSYGDYQILPETAYRYTSFAGNPEDLKDSVVANKVYFELVKRMNKLSGGDLRKAIRLWNKNPDYLPSLIEKMKEVPWGY